ncbi:MAG TPA: hypothetical protein PLU13_07290, partial [Thermomonas sp.]|nr:hypothetical protein [Thermomonas sp.]
LRCGAAAQAASRSVSDAARRMRMRQWYALLVIPAKAEIHGHCRSRIGLTPVDSRFRGNDGWRVRRAIGFRRNY